MSTDQKFMRMAISAARKCVPEDARTHPRVGVVVVPKQGGEPVEAYRGELQRGEHAEFTALEKKLADVALSGAIVYTTLEPCTTRNHPKIPCAERLIERKVARVVIGMLDPNPKISGRGLRRLREANIAAELFPADLMAEIEDMNREFIRDQKRTDESPLVERSIILQNQKRRLDEWYRSLNRIYWDRNHDRAMSGVFAHLVEVIGGLSLLASSKRKPNVDPEGHIIKAVAWWLALCGKAGIRSVEEVLWDKFPGVCSYCHKKPHDPDICGERKAATGGPVWEILADLGRGKEKPSRLREWQLMFSEIYPAQQTEDYGPSFARLSEELGELAEAVRVFPAEPGYFLSEAADVFAWLMHIQNIVDRKTGVPREKRGEALEHGFCITYPDSCKECGKRTCACPPILSSTIGRIAHEVPRTRATYDNSGRFMTPDRVSQYFQDR